MLTKNEMRSVSALQDKRERDRLGLYVVEGDKLVREAISLGLDVEVVYGESAWIGELPSCPPHCAPRVVEVTRQELHRLSAQVAPHGALAILRKPCATWEWHSADSDLVLVLEAVQDPGNLGSLLRVGVWFGIADIVLSSDGADPFQPKAVQASMGAVFHVRVHSVDVRSFVREAEHRGFPIYAATLAGESIYDAELGSHGLLLFGNESSGLSAESLVHASKRLTIPAWRDSGPGRDSLNVAMAAAIVCAEFRRRGARATVRGQSGDLA